MREVAKTASPRTELHAAARQRPDKNARRIRGIVFIGSGKGYIVTPATGRSIWGTLTTEPSGCWAAFYGGAIKDPRRALGRGRSCAQMAGRTKTVKVSECHDKPPKAYPVRVRRHAKPIARVLFKRFGDGSSTGEFVRGGNIMTS